MFNRSQPSQRYLDLLKLYQDFHNHTGETFLGIKAEDTYPGVSLFPHLDAVKELIKKTDSKTILDYGAGKGRQYQAKIKVRGEEFQDVSHYWNTTHVHCYDPAYREFTDLPTETFDGVICTDVLEHCPEEDIDWILAEIFSYAEKFVYCNIACFFAMQRLPNGENAHCTIRSPRWWAVKFQQAGKTNPKVLFHATFDCSQRNIVGKRETVQHSITNG